MTKESVLTPSKQSVESTESKVHSSYSNIAIIGLGYVGLPLLIELAKHFKLTGFDVDTQKIDELNQNIDRTNELNSKDLEACNASFTPNLQDLKKASVKIVTVPTPIDSHNKPDLTLLKKATEMLAQHVNPQDIIVYESTVYPGVTEEVCTPIIGNVTGLTLNKDFFLGYSPERLSPGDNAHSLTKIVKIVSGSTPETTDILEYIYGKIVSAGIHKAASIKVAEAAKVIENTQRDLNIALMNELSIIFNKMGINTLDVIDAAATKWNFMRMTPGLVGGHCIGVDPYYLTHKATELGYHPDVILAGRMINDNMGKYIANQVIKLMVKANIPIKDSRIGIFGLTFKENVSDIRNSKVVDIINELNSFGIQAVIHDPHADPKDTQNEYNLELTNLENMNNLDTIIVAVNHKSYKSFSVETLAQRIKHKNAVIYDIKATLPRPKKNTANVFYETL